MAKSKEQYEERKRIITADDKAPSEEDREKCVMYWGGVLALTWVLGEEKLPAAQWRHE